MIVRKKSLLVSLVLLAVVWSFAAAPAYCFPPLGDTGKPADYNKTMKRFKDHMTDFASATQSLAPSYDFRDLGVVTPAKDQGNCGSCWSFATVGVFESKLLMAGDGTFDLSEQQQVSCNTSMAGCGGGNSLALRYWETKGPMEQSCTGYPSYNGSSYPCSSLSACSLLSYYTKDYYTVDTSDVNEIKTSLYADGPAYFRFYVYGDFYTFWSTRSPGAVYKQTSGTYQGGHAVLLIGWDDTKQAWLLKNSWGATAGPNGDGTFWMAYTGHANNLDFGTANVHLVATDTTGSLTVTISPTAAVTAGAQWQVDGGTWRNSGTTVTGLTAGAHTVAFKAVTGWTAPASKSVTITAGATSSATGTYSQTTGSPQCDHQPGGGGDGGRPVAGGRRDLAKQRRHGNGPHGGRTHCSLQSGHRLDHPGKQVGHDHCGSDGNHNRHLRPGDGVPYRDHRPGGGGDGGRSVAGGRRNLAKQRDHGRRASPPARIR